MKGLKLLLAVILLIGVSLFSEQVIHPMESIEGLDDDHTGALFGLTNEFVSHGRSTVLVTPSGEAEETKVAFELSGDSLDKWIGNDLVLLSLYIHPETKILPNSFFLGMADVQDGWEWVDGTFTRMTVSEGWNEVEYHLLPAMQELNEDGNYMLYFSFFKEETGAKEPLETPFGIGSVVAVVSDLLPSRAYIWDMECEEEIATFDDDNTGALFEQDHCYVSKGKSSLKVIPSGDAAETKVALDLAGEKINTWSEAEYIAMEVFVPQETELIPTMLFMGMADLTEGWDWIDGLFPVHSLDYGWNTVKYYLSDNMRALDENGHYKIYLAFAHEDAEGQKIPLETPFYIDGLYAEITPVIEEEEPETEIAYEPPVEEVLTYIWSMDSEEEIDTFDDDNTGAIFELSRDVVLTGNHSMKVIPSGDAEETKAAMPVPQDRILYWSKSNQITLNVFVPEDNELVPSMFFLGMADLTSDWEWVGGVFSEDTVEPGMWSTVSYDLAGSMKDIREGRDYVIYLAFAGIDEENRKIPLFEPFYLDGMFVETTEVMTIEERLARADPERVDEIEAMLDMDDDELLDLIQYRTFLYFWELANPDNGLVIDRSREGAPASIAAVGFGLAAIPVAIERGWITHDEGYERILTTLRSFAEGKVEGHRGFFYHFVDMRTGERVWECELSSIDTALLMAGVIVVSEFFKGTDVEALGKELYEAVDWNWMLAGGDTLSMGWKPEGPAFLRARWDSFNEGILAYILAIGSPTYSISPSTWDNIYRPVRDTFVSLPQETLFVYQYPNVFVDFRDKEDKYANYFNNATVATRYNWLYSFMQRFEYETYDTDIWGLSASDGPTGYKAYGAADGNHDGTVAPYAPIASIVFTPDLSLRAIRAMLERYGPLVWSDYGFVSAFNADAVWFSQEHIGIDQGSIILMIENYRSELIWELFMSSDYIQSAIEKIGFEHRVSDYAVKPEYAEEFERLLTDPELKTAVAPKATEPISIDGDLTEWADVSGTLVSEDMNVPAGGIMRVDKTRQILHSYFYAMWDEENLYLAARVHDEYVVINIEPTDRGAYYRTDSIEFYIDPGRAGSEKGLFKLAMIAFDTEGNPQAVRHEDASPGPISEVAPDVEIASARTEYGYDVEIKIPLKYLSIEPQPGIEIGFSHTIHNSNVRDADVGAYVRENILSWNPVADVWANPEAWGTLRFEE